MSDDRKAKLPIGYWLKKVDELLTKRVGEAQSSNGLSRPDWQIMNVVREAGSAKVREIAEVLRPFASDEEVAAACAELQIRGILGDADGDALRLSEGGKELYERALNAQRAVRRQAMSGISESDFEATLLTLQRIATNLDSDGGT